MFLNSETDYAIRIVSCLAENGGRVDAQTVSEQTGVTQRYSLKILHKLTCSGIVKSYKGAKGGYVLSRPPEEITLYDVYEVICGPITVSKCESSSDACTHPKGVCYFRSTFEDVSLYMRECFKKATFSGKEIK
ncbi:MAG: Rrf2 family transcriptional regulator [Clostridiales bacterium]|nr:Rrf2 family transcriptional regulator [Candidatus Equinaster intestinalis]